MELSISSLSPPTRPSKIGRVLFHLACGDSLNRFEAECQLHDHTLNSTISDLIHDYDVVITKTWETVEGFLGVPTQCIRYSVLPHPDNLAQCESALRSLGYQEPHLLGDQQGGGESFAKEAL